MKPGATQHVCQPDIWLYFKQNWILWASIIGDICTKQKTGQCQDNKRQKKKRLEWEPGAAEMQHMPPLKCHGGFLFCAAVLILQLGGSKRESLSSGLTLLSVSSVVKCYRCLWPTNLQENLFYVLYVLSEVLSCPRWFVYLSAGYWQTYNWCLMMICQTNWFHTKLIYVLIQLWDIHCIIT